MRIRRTSKKTAKSALAGLRGRHEPDASVLSPVGLDLHFSRPKGLLAGFMARERRQAGCGALLEVGENWVGRDWRIGEHNNPGWELFFQTKGASEWRCGRATFKVPAGGYYLIQPGARHQLLRFLDADSHYYFVVFDPDHLRLARPDSWRHPFQAGSGGHVFENPLRGLIREVTLQQRDKEQGILLYLEALGLEINRLQNPGHHLQPELAVHPAALRARELMIERPGERWRMDELAALCGVSVPHLIEIFRRSFGAPPHKFLLRHRLGLARERLSQRMGGITELALEIGFSSSQHFAGAYHREFGCSPSAHSKFAVKNHPKKKAPPEPPRSGGTSIKPAA